MSYRDKAILSVSGLIIVLALVPPCAIKAVLCLLLGIASGASLAHWENERKR